MGEGCLFITIRQSDVSLLGVEKSRTKPKTLKGALLAAIVALSVLPDPAKAQSPACVMLPAIASETIFSSADPSSTATIGSGAAGRASGLQVDLRSTDPVGPFPLSALVPFSWASIDGIWSMKLPDGTALYLSLQVQADCDGRRFLKVINFDQKSFRVQSEGVGLALANDTTVRAVMTSPTSQHMIFVRQYKVPVGKAGSKISTVVTIRPFNGSNNEDVHMIARKASSLTLDQYIQRQRKLEAERAARSVR